MKIKTVKDFIDYIADTKEKFYDVEEWQLLVDTNGELLDITEFIYCDGEIWITTEEKGK